MSLGHFITTYRNELIQRTRAKVAKRASPHPREAELGHGVPIFLSQLALVLDEEGKAATSGNGQKVTALHPPDEANEAMMRSARLHGQELLKFGFSLEQVVHDYGDVCQAVTELALEQAKTVTTSEFHTLNRCLDNAIAGAVTSWNDEREVSRGDGQRNSLEQELSGHLASAIGSFEALHAGHVGPTGATALVLGRSLNKMQTLLAGSKRET